MKMFRFNSRLLLIACCILCCTSLNAASSKLEPNQNAKHVHVKSDRASDQNVSKNPFFLMKTTRSNAGWWLMLGSKKHWDRVEAKPLESDIWTPTQAQGENFSVSFADLAPMAEIEVRGIRTDGSYSPAYLIQFDAMREIEKQAMQILQMTPRSWVGLSKDGLLLYFSHALSWRCGVKEVRYSIDSSELDRVYDLPPCDFDDPVRIPNDADIYTRFQEPAEYVAVQLIYVDGSVSDVVRFRPGMGM